MKQGSKVTAPASLEEDSKTPPRLETYYDDSSDEDDDYQEVGEEKLVENVTKFVATHPNIPQKTSEVAFVLEDQGRRVLYDKLSREKYHQKRQSLKFDGEEVVQNIQNINFLEVLTSALQIACERLYPKAKTAIKVADLIKDFIAEYTQNPDKKSILPRLVLKQSNGEFIIREFAEIAKLCKDKILELYIAEIGQSVAIQNSQKIAYQLSAEKLLVEDKIKTPLQRKIKDKLTEFQNQIKIIQEEIKQIDAREVSTDQEKEQQKKDKLAQEMKIYQKLVEAQQFFGVALSDSIKLHLRGNKLNATALNGLSRNILQAEIGKYLVESFGDQIKPGLAIGNSFLLNDALQIARDGNLQTITNCTKAKFEAGVGQNNLRDVKSREIDNGFGMFLGAELREVLQQKYFVPLNRKVLKRSYADTEAIKGVADLYAKEHMLYRSTTRQHRNSQYQDVARSIIFDDDTDLAVQKQQNVTAGSGGSMIANRGTVQEMVLNLGSYSGIASDTVLKKLSSINEDDKFSAALLRAVYRGGIDKLKKTKLDDVRTWFDFLTTEQKQTIVTLVELFFGTEGFRSPTAIVEVNMAIDLIIAGKASWKEMLSGKKAIGEGGDLSLTMKAGSGGGGTESGRRLSEDVNQYHDRMHKYGGEPIKKGDAGYGEFLSRKVVLVDKWIELKEEEEAKKQKDDKVKQEEKPKTAMTPRSFAGLIKAQDEKWYGRKL